MAMCTALAAIITEPRTPQGSIALAGQNPNQGRVNLFTREAPARDDYRQ